MLAKRVPVHRSTCLSLRCNKRNISSVGRVVENCESSDCSARSFLFILPPFSRNEVAEFCVTTFEIRGDVSIVDVDATV